MHEFIYKTTDELIDRLKNIPDYSLSNFILQGMPGSGVHMIFDKIMEIIKDESRNFIDISAGEFRFTPTNKCVDLIIKKIQQQTQQYCNIENNHSDLETALIDFRDIVNSITRNEEKICFTIRDFDIFSKAQDQEGIQHLFNTWQVLGANPKSGVSFIICSYKDIEDVCSAVSYSEFHKIFGTNRFRVPNIGLEDAKVFFEQQVEDYGVNVIEELLFNSGGMYEHLLHFFEAYKSGQDDWKRRALDMISWQYKDWCDLLTPAELDVIQLIINGNSLSHENNTGLNKLIRKGLVSNLPPMLAANLFKQYMLEREGIQNEKNMPFIRKSSILPDPDHLYFMQKMCKGWSLIEWTLMQEPRGDEAIVYKLTGEDSKGTCFRPIIMKVHKIQNMEEELTSLRQAKEMLGTVVPAILGEESYKGKKAILLEYASGDNNSFKVLQFGDHYDNLSIEDVEGLLEKIFKNIFYPLYQRQSPKIDAYKKYLFLPRVHLGEWDKISEICYKSPFWNNSIQKLELRDKYYSFENPGKLLRPGQGEKNLYYNLFVAKKDMGTFLAHGDLNPRNILIDGIGNISTIDFPLLKESALRFTDATRLETEIRYKLTLEETSEMSAYLEVMINNSNINQLKALSNLPLKYESKKMLKSIISIRESCFSIAEFGNEEKLLFEYNLTLLGQILRIVLFEDYLNEQQKYLAILSIASLTNYLNNQND